LGLGSEGNEGGLEGEEKEEARRAAGEESIFSRLKRMTSGSSSGGSTSGIVFGSSESKGWWRIFIYLTSLDHLHLHQSMMLILLLRPTRVWDQD